MLNALQININNISNTINTNTNIGLDISYVTSAKKQSKWRPFYKRERERERETERERER
jgi:hypothetical protein